MMGHLCTLTVPCSVCCGGFVTCAFTALQDCNQMMTNFTHRTQNNPMTAQMCTSNCMTNYRTVRQALNASEFGSYHPTPVFAPQPVNLCGCGVTCSLT